MEKHLPALDGLRGLAILLVLIYHFGEFVSLGSGFLSDGPLIGACWSGVDLFFVLSGFLLGGILIDHRQSPNLWAAFYARRAGRILPLYLAMVLIFTVMMALRPGRLEWLLTGNAFPTWTYFAFVQNFFAATSNTFGPTFLGPSWSLAVEEQFYLVIPIVIRLVSPRRLPFVLITGIALAPILRNLTLQWFSNCLIAPYALLPCRMDALLMGVLCAWIVRQPFFHDTRRAMAIPFWLLFVGTLFFAVRFSGVGKPAITLGFTWLAAFYAALLLTLVSPGSALSKAIFSFAPLRHLGSIAYGIYLFHVPVVGIVFAVLFNEPPRMSNMYEVMAASFALCCTVGMAMLSLKYFERRFQTMGRSIRYEWSPVTWRSIALAARDRTPMI